LDSLLSLLGTTDSDGEVKAIERAVLRIERTKSNAARIASEVTTRASLAVRPLRARLTHLAGRLVQEQERAQRDPEGTAMKWLLEALRDADPKTRHVAARALAKVKFHPNKSESDADLTLSSAIKQGLLDAFDRGKDDEDRRALALALGMMGG